MKKAIKNMIDGTETLVAQEYLNKIVLNISSVINMEYVFIARTDVETNISSTIATAINGVLSENFEYSLKDTPCDNVVNGSICVYEDKVAEVFSKDQLLIDMNIEGYVGLPLYNSKKKVIGIIVAVSKKPIDNSDFILTIMKLFFGRIAAEVDRMDKDYQLQLLNETLEEKVKFATIDLQRAQRIANVGSWKYVIDKDILEWSDETYNIFQVDKIKNPIKNLNDFLTKLDSHYTKILKEAYNAHLKDRVSYDITHEIILDDGTSKWIKERCETSYDDDGRPMVSNGTVQDVSKEVQRNQYLIQQSRMAQMGEMISMIAHQWRQPLGIIAVIVSNLKLISQFKDFDLGQKQEAEKYEEAVNEKMDHIDRLVKSLTTTIDDFRNFYKPNKQSDTIKLEEVCIKSLSIINSSLISNNIKVIEEYSSDDVLKIYTNEMIQVVLNILKNAQDNFLEKDIKEPYIKISTNDKVLSICDNGGGIPEDVIDKIFNPYFSTKEEKNGTGLGLYMSKTIVEEHHNGKLVVENTHDGVCFKIELV